MKSDSPQLFSPDPDHPSRDVPPGSAEPTLARALGARMAMAVVVGNVIGSGIFFKPGVIAANGGQFGLILLVWVVGGVLCLLGALCFAELGTMLPKAGGLYVYLREAYGALVAFLFGWSEFLFARPASIGALSVAFVGSLAYALQWQLSTWGLVLLSSLLIGGMAWINIVGVLWGGRMQMATTAVKVGVLSAMAALPFVLMPLESGPDAPSFANFATTINTSGTPLATRFGLMLLAVMWAYDGWHGITPLAEEVRDPQRNIPIALLGGIGLLILLYLGATFAYHSALTMQQMSAAGQDAASVMLQKLLGPAGVAAITCVILCSTFGAINTNLLYAPRVTFAMGRDGVFFRGLGAVHVNYHTPAVAILVTALMSIGLIAGVALAKELLAGADPVTLTWELPRRVVTSLQAESLHQSSIFELLTNFVIFSVSIFYSLGVLAVIVLRIRQPDAERPYRTWGYPLVPILFLGSYSWFIWQIYQEKPFEALTGIFLICLGVPVYAYFAIRNRARQIIGNGPSS